MVLVTLMEPDESRYASSTLTTPVCAAPTATVLGATGHRHRDNTRLPVIDFGHLARGARGDRC